MSRPLPPAPVWVRATAGVIRRLPAGRYRLLHRLSRLQGRTFLMTMPREAGGYRFECELGDAIAREVCFTGRYEPQETALVHQILKPGMAFVDVGANWGYFTLLAAHLVGDAGRVLSLEPDPRLFSTLQGNAARNHLRQVTTRPLAAARESGVMTLAGYDARDGNFGLSRLRSSPASEGTTFQVECAPLDRILDADGLLSVDLMKMDIEGGEALALPGLETSLARATVKRLLLELHPRQLLEGGGSVTQALETLRSAGYRGWVIDHSPAATRAAAYGRVGDIKQLLQRWEEPVETDPWPHHLWLAPGTPPPWLSR